jgi:hypothetical protein
MKWAGHIARVGDKLDVYWVLVGKTLGSRPLERPRRKREDNIKTKLKTNLRGRSPQANYTDLATAACRRSKTEINGRRNSLRWPRNTLYPQKLDNIKMVLK